MQKKSGTEATKAHGFNRLRKYIYVQALSYLGFGIEKQQTRHDCGIEFDG